MVAVFSQDFGGGIGSRQERKNESQEARRRTSSPHQINAIQRGVIRLTETNIPRVCRSCCIARALCLRPARALGFSECVHCRESRQAKQLIRSSPPIPTSKGRQGGCFRHAVAAGMLHSRIGLTRQQQVRSNTELASSREIKLRCSVLLPIFLHIAQVCISEGYCCLLDLIRIDFYPSHNRITRSEHG